MTLYLLTIRGVLFVLHVWGFLSTYIMSIGQMTGSLACQRQWDLFKTWQIAVEVKDPTTSWNGPEIKWVTDQPILSVTSVVQIHVCEQYYRKLNSLCRIHSGS